MKILVIEDDMRLCAAIERELSRAGYLTDCCHDGEEALLYGLNEDYAYDLMVVDRMLPSVDGLTVIKTMRSRGIQIPALIITGMEGLDDRVEGLDGGADDYLVKPFYMKELLSRVRALIRRPAAVQEEHALEYGDLSLDRKIRRLSCLGQPVFLTARENSLLAVFLAQPETLFTREQLVLRVWGTDSEVEPGNVDNYISFLRKRLRTLGSQCELRTVYGSGFRMEKKDAG